MKHSSKSSFEENKLDAIGHTSGFFYREDVIRWILRIFYACCTGLFLLDFFIHRHTEADFEKIPTFYAIFGLVACLSLVLIAKWIRTFLIRKENYYDEPEDPKEFLLKQGLELPKSYKSYNSNSHSISSNNNRDNQSNDKPENDLEDKR